LRFHKKLKNHVCSAIGCGARFATPHEGRLHSRRHHPELGL
jgi:uncharacterized Zn-finger protein